MLQSFELPNSELGVALQPVFSTIKVLSIPDNDVGYIETWNNVLFNFLVKFNKTILPLTLLGYEMIVTNSALCISLAIYHLISNACSWNNCYFITVPSTCCLRSIR